MKSRRDILIEYLKSAVEVGDWHAVSDAANDLRVLEAQGSVTPKYSLAAECADLKLWTQRDPTVKA